MRCRMYISDSLDGWHNLGVDEYFLDTVQPDEVVLYLYVNASAVVIGVSQNPWAECDLDAMQRDNVQLVRRVSGGGAVYHDRGNLNFSFICGHGVYDQERQMEMIQSAVRDLGIPCAFTGRNDLQVEGRKFSGNAFCSRKNARQHHGTLLVHSDLTRLARYLTVHPEKLRSKGTKSVRSRVCNLSEYHPGLDVSEMKDALCLAFERAYGDFKTMTRDDLNEQDVKPYVLRQASDEWKMGKTLPFDVKIEHRFAWGGLQLLLSLEHARICGVQAYSDALDTDLCAELQCRLKGVELRPESMCDALASSDKVELRELASYLAAWHLQ